MQPPAPATHALENFSTSLYFWWLALLRCSKDYWWICKQGGNCQDARLVRIWEQFGDIHTAGSVLPWWQTRGTNLFDSPQVEMEFVTRLIGGLVLVSDKNLAKAIPEMICLAIPKQMASQDLMLSIAQAWDLARVRGGHFNKGATFKLSSVANKSAALVISAYRLSLLQVVVNNTVRGDEMYQWGSYEMGLHLRISPKSKPRNQDTLASARKKQANIRTIYSQHKKAAADLIANVEIGIFPSKEPVPYVRRWTERQQCELDHAVQSGVWQNAGWLQKEHAFMLPQSSFWQDGADRLTAREQAMGMIDDFSQLRTSFLEPKRKRTANFRSFVNE